MVSDVVSATLSALDVDRRANDPRRLQIRARFFIRLRLAAADRPQKFWPVFRFARPRFFARISGDAAVADAIDEIVPTFSFFIDGAALAEILDAQRALRPRGHRWRSLAVSLDAPRPIQARTANKRHNDARPI